MAGTAEARKKRHSKGKGSGGASKQQKWGGGSQ